MWYSRSTSITGRLFNRSTGLSGILNHLRVCYYTLTKTIVFVGDFVCGIWFWFWIFFDGILCFFPGRSGSAHAQEETKMDTGAPPKLEENLGKHTTGSTTDSDVVKRYYFWNFRPQGCMFAIFKYRCMWSWHLEMSEVLAFTVRLLVSS